MKSNTDTGRRRGAIILACALVALMTGMAMMEPAVSASRISELGQSPGNFEQTTDELNNENDGELSEDLELVELDETGNVADFDVAGSAEVVEEDQADIQDAAESEENDEATDEANAEEVAEDDATSDDTQEEAEETVAANSAVLKEEQTLSAVIYKDDRYEEVNEDDETVITIEGKLPVDEVTGELAVEAKAFAVDVEGIDVYEGQEALFAYDIVIFYKDAYKPENSDGTFQPKEEEKLNVKFESPALAEIDSNENNTLSVYYIPEEEEERAELVAVEEQVKDLEVLTYEVEEDLGTLSFDAGHFSTYAVFLETLYDIYDINDKVTITNMTFEAADSNGAFSPDKNHTIKFTVKVDPSAGNSGYYVIYKGDYFGIKMPKGLDFSGFNSESTLSINNSDLTATQKIYYEEDGTPVLHVTFGGKSGATSYSVIYLDFSYTVPFNKDAIRYNDINVSQETVTNTLALSTYNNGSSKTLDIEIMAAQNGTGGSGDITPIVEGDGGRYYIPKAQYKYQTSPLSVAASGVYAYDTSLYVLVKEGTAGYQNHANSTYWRNYKGIEWTLAKSASAGGSLPYDVAYCYEPDAPFATTDTDLNVGMTKIALAENPYLLPSEKAAYEAIILNSYPFISASEMRTRLASAGVSNANSLTISELMAGTQLAIWRVSQGANYGGVKTNVERPYGATFGVDQLYPISESQYTNPYYNTAAKNNVAAIATALKNFNTGSSTSGVSEAKLYGYTYKVNTNPNGTKKLTAYVTLTRDLKSSESGVLTITDSKGNSAQKTLPGGTSKNAIEIVLDNVAADETTFNLKLDVTDSAGGIKVYTYVKSCYQNMIGACPGTSKYNSTCKIVIKQNDEKTQLKVKKQWVGDSASTRPTSIVVDLYANGVKVPGQSKTLTGPNWEAVWENLTKYDTEGNEIKYTAREAVTPAGYKVTYVDSTDSITETTSSSSQSTTTQTTTEYKWTPISSAKLQNQAFRIRSGNKTFYYDGSSVKTIDINDPNADDHAYEMLWTSSYKGVVSQYDSYQFVSNNNGYKYLTFANGYPAVTNSATVMYCLTSGIMAQGNKYITSSFGLTTSYSGAGCFTFETLQVCQHTETTPGGGEETVVSTIPMTTITNRISHEPEVEYEIIKTDSQTGSPLAGATFELVDQSTGQKTVIVTGSDGKVKVKLNLGRTYKLYETVAPHGYEIVEALDINHGLTITVSSDGKITTTGPSSSDWSFETESSKIDVGSGDTVLAWAEKRTSIGGYTVGGAAFQYAQNRAGGQTIPTYCMNAYYGLGEVTSKSTFVNFDVMNVGDSKIANYTGYPTNSTPSTNVTNKTQFAQDMYDVLYAGYPNDGLGLRARIKEAYPSMSDANIDLMFAMATQQIMWHYIGDIPEDVFNYRLTHANYKALAIMWNAIKDINLTYDHTYKIIVLMSYGSYGGSQCNQNLVYIERTVGRLNVKNHVKPETPEVEYELLKVDSETGEPLVGATFELVNQRTGAVKTIVTGADGKISMKLLPGETYKLYEISAPEGYDIVESLAKPNGLTITVSSTGVITTTGMGADEDWEFTTDTVRIPLSGQGAYGYGNYYSSLDKETLNMSVQFVKDASKTTSFAAYCMNKGYGMRYESDPVKYDRYNILTLGDTNAANYTGDPTKTYGKVSATSTYAQNLFDVLYAGYPYDGLGIRTQIAAQYPTLSESEIDALFHAATQNAVWYINGDLTATEFASCRSRSKAARIFWEAISQINISYVHSYKIIILECPGVIQTAVGSQYAQNIVYLDKTVGKLKVKNSKTAPKEVDLKVIKLWEEDDPGYFEVTHTQIQNGKMVVIQAALKKYLEGEKKIILIDLGENGDNPQVISEGMLNQSNNWSVKWTLPNTGWENPNSFVGHRYYVILEHNDIEVQLVRKIPGTQDQYEYLDKLTIGANTNWVGVFEGLPEKDENGNVYEYSVIETSGGDGYQVIISGTNNGLVYVKNYQGEKIELPVTGGMGLTPLFTFGILTTVISAILLYRNRIFNSERGED